MSLKTSLHFVMLAISFVMKRGMKLYVVYIKNKYVIYVRGLSQSTLTKDREGRVLQMSMQVNRVQYEEGEVRKCQIFSM